MLHDAPGSLSDQKHKLLWLRIVCAPLCWAPFAHKESCCKIETFIVGRFCNKRKGGGPSKGQLGPLVAPYRAIPRDYLSDTPLLRAMGFLVSQHDQLSAIPPPRFLSVSPLESMRSGGAIPPLKEGISAILARYPMKNKPNGCDTPLCDTISKGYCAIWGVTRPQLGLFFVLKFLRSQGLFFNRFQSP